MTRLPVGEVTITSAARAAVAAAGVSPESLLERFWSGDWGAEDRYGRART